MGGIHQELLTLREMMEVLMGKEGKRKLRLRHKGNPELFQLYDAQLILKHRSREALEEARRVLGHFKAYLGDYPPSPELAAAFLAQFADRKPATLYRYHAIVKGFMAWYGEPLEARVKVPETLPTYVEDGDLERLREAMRGNRTHKRVVERNLLLVELDSKTGLRRSELANLRVGDIDLRRGCLVVRQGKGMKDRIVDLAPSLAERLTPFIQGREPDEPLLGVTPESISGIIRRFAIKAGVSLHTHSLRDYFASKLIDAGADVEVVRRLLGHSSLRNTQRYLARTDAQRKEAINRLDMVPAPQPVKDVVITEKVGPVPPATERWITIEYRGGGH